MPAAAVNTTWLLGQKRSEAVKQRMTLMGSKS